jgi:hypothetical protein
MTDVSSMETFRCRIYAEPVEPITELQCNHCRVIADDTEPGMSREAVRALRGRMEARGWIVADVGDDEDAKVWRDSVDYCSRECAVAK